MLWEMTSSSPMGPGKQWESICAVPGLGNHNLAISEDNFICQYCNCKLSHLMAALTMDLH